MEGILDGLLGTVKALPIRPTWKNNPNPALRTRQLVGLDILSGFVYEGDNDWSGGTIYDPNNGKTYKCLLALEDDGKDKNKLRVRGFIGVSLFGRTDVWTRKP